MKKLFLPCTSLLLLFLVGNSIHLHAQNLFPTAKGSSVKIDGGWLNIAAPVTTGGWARGISFYNPDMSVRSLEMGLYGSAATAQRLYITFAAASPWNSLSGLHLLQNGNVGIGVLDPKARLAVDGNILAKEIKIKTNVTVPDYVFEADYRLPSLASIEAFVKEHKHLPEIPSATEIQKDGLDLATMNLLLLKKMEELTLHLIEKEKRIEALESRVQQLEQ